MSTLIHDEAIAFELASLENEVRTLREQANARPAEVLSSRDLDRFKAQVVEVAGRYAREHGWCDEVKEALAELGLDMKPRKYHASITATFEVEVESEDELSEYDFDVSEVTIDLPYDNWNVVNDSYEVDSVDEEE